MSRPELKRIQPDSFFLENHMAVVLRERDHAITEVTIQEGHTNPYGRLHGGAFYTLGDSAAGNAAHTDGRVYVTQYSSIHFLDNTTVGHTVRAESHVRHRGRSTCLCVVDFTDEAGRLLATGEYTYFCVGQGGTGRG